MEKENDMANFFSYDNEDEDDIIEKKEEIKRSKKRMEDDYKSDLADNISELSSNIESMLKEIDEPIENLFPSEDLLPHLDMEVNIHDYEKDIQLIKISSKETINCLANLYLDEETMKNKNINNIIKEDAEKLSELNFSVSCAKRALIMCMKQLDMGINDPEMFNSVTMFQKEMRDTIKMAYELQNRMKDFYKGIKGELEELNSGQDIEDDLQAGNLNVIGDPKELNNIIDAYKDDPTLLDRYNTDQNSKILNED